MNCEAFWCKKFIKEGNLICLDLNGIDIKTGVTKKIKMLVSVCDDCIKKHKYEHKVRGSIKILDT